MSQRRSRVDLHIHSTASDGVYAPSEIVQLALEREISAIALTDHDTLSGVSEAQRAAIGTGLEVISGVEVNSEGEWGDLHFLGYCVEPESEPLREQLRATQDARLERARKMVKRLSDLGMPMAWEEVRALADGKSIGRPHIAQALLNHGYVDTFDEAFERFIGRDGPAYFSRLKLSPPTVIRLILEAGGVPVLAHPAHSGPAAVEAIPDLADRGLRGAEVYHPDHSPEDSEKLLALCREYDLIATGGSDFHGPGVHRGGELGSAQAPIGSLKRLRAASSHPAVKG